MQLKTWRHVVLLQMSAVFKLIINGSTFFFVCVKPQFFCQIQLPLSQFERKMPIGRKPHGVVVDHIVPHLSCPVLATCDVILQCMFVLVFIYNY